MLVLLPPSEGKTPPPTGGPTLDLDALSAPGLSPVREKVLDALVRASGRPDALTVLGAGPSLAGEVARNVHLLDAPAAPARRVYTGVLYAAAGLDRLTPAARARSERAVRIVSGLWGLVTPADHIPAYRLSMGTDLPGLGPLAAVWRGPLGIELDARVTQDAELVVDCRSAAYLAAWRPPTAAARERWVTVRVVRELDGHRTVVSHHAKHTRGVLTRHLLARPGQEPRDAEHLARAARELVGSLHGDTAPAALGPGTDGFPGAVLRDVELSGPGRGPRVLTLVVG
ncbi:YaaA family protein [Cellulomonas hominis]